MFHRGYWSCSKFSDWLGGSKKPPHATAEGWDEFNKEAKNKHPIRFWMADTLLDCIQDVVCYPYHVVYSTKCYLNNRYITKSHALTADKRDIQPGSWRDVGDRFLPCLFNELVDFVEIESAHMNMMWNDDSEKYNRPWWASKLLRFKEFRCREAGVNYLVWASKLTSGTTYGLLETDADYNKQTLQAIGAIEILELYEWFTLSYRNRPDPYDLIADEEWYKTDPCGMLYDGVTISQKQKEYKKAILDQIQQIEKDNKQEETDMLIRLVNIRDHLWT